MRIFTRYILREVVGYALLGGVLFTFILFMRYLLPLLELAVRGIASPLDLLRLIGYLLPNFLNFTIPMAVLIGVLLGLGRLAADSEVTAMRATGDNPQMIRALGVDVGSMITMGLAVSNGLVAVSGALLAQYQGFADVQMGIGMVVWGLASVIIGEALNILAQTERL